MASKKRAVPDDVLYRNFTMGCPYKTNGKKIRAINACVRCKEDTIDKKHGYPSHCKICGWNPACQRERLTKMVGEFQANKLMAQSEELAAVTRQRINNGDYPYDV